MLRNKRILLIIILAVALFLIPNMCNAATIPASETTKTSTGVEVKWSYELNETGEIVNLLCTNIDAVSGNLNIPSTIDGKTVRALGKMNYSDGIFESCEGLTGITLPNTLNTIGYRAFYNCSGIKGSIDIPDTVTKVGEAAFQNTSITSVSLSENMTSISRYLFNGCVALKNITMPSKLTTIEDSAFRGCVALESITIPDTVTKIEGNVFRECSALTNITLSKNLTKIDENLFHNCISLTSIIIPESVTFITGGTYESFRYCKSLEKVLIPDGVVVIEDGAFEDCSKLTIYGNDGKVSKRYAEANNINFDYISNWNNAAVGDDITPPTLKDLEIEFSHSFEYDEGTTYYLAPTGMNISIKAYFEEEVYGETAPTLTIKCGNGENITLTNGVIQGEFIVYTYTIKNTDKGIISAVSMTGGDIKDKTGNLAKEYTCPKLTTSYIIGENFVFANGTDSIIENEGNNNQNQGTTVTLSSISITKTPTRNTYTEGSSFEKTGMVVTATYSDGSTKEITNYTISPSGALKSSDTKVVISYTENGVTKTVEQKITVIAKGANNNDSNSSNNSNFKNDTTKDTTIKNDNKLPQTGTTVLTLSLISLIAVAVVSKVKCGKYKDI